MNMKSVSYILGWVLNIEAALMSLPLVTSLIYNEGEGWAFAIVMAMCAGLGFLLTHKRLNNPNFRAREGFVATALSWILMSVFGCLPFYFTGEIPRFIDALFETVSGFTTTGASILSDVETMLCAVDSTIRARLATGADSCFVVFHPSLTYFARLYGLRQMVLEEHGKEPSASHIKHTVDEARRLGVGKIFIQAEFDKKHAESIARELNAAIITIDPLSYNWRGEMLNIADQLKNGKE